MLSLSLKTLIKNIINAVNDKWLIIAGTRERFVFSEKSDFDGRTREYFINEKLLSSALLK